MQDKSLNYKQKAFTECYTKDLDCKGNATQSAIKAGYKQRTAYSMGQRLLKHVEVKRVIDEITEEIRNNSVATRILRQEFWTTTMNNRSESMSDRLRASELLGKSEADFTENYADKTTRPPEPQSESDRKLLSDIAAEVIRRRSIKLKGPEKAVG